MPVSTRGRARSEAVFVAVSSKIAYGWKSRDLSELSGITQNDLYVQLGHRRYGQVGVDVTGPLVAVMGANSPKPARVTKRFNAGISNSVSTFAAFNKLADAQAAGWKISKIPAPMTWRNPELASRSVDVGVYLTSGEIKLWKLERGILNNAQMQYLGLKFASDISEANKPRVTRGSSSKPGLAEIRLDNNEKTTVPYSTASTGPDDIDSNPLYKVLTGEFIPYPSFEAPF